MKDLFIFILIILINILVLNSAKQCYEGNLNFSDVPCFDNPNYSDFLKGESCRDIICAGYAEDLKAHICIHKKPRKFKFMIFGERANLTFDISSFAEDEEYTIKRIAISGSHVSMLLSSIDAAYRMSFNIGELIGSDSISLIYMGPVENILWEAFNDSDVYIERKDSEVTEKLKIPHNIAAKNDTINQSQRCIKFKKIHVEEITSTSTTTSMSAIVVPQKIVITDMNAIIFSIGICIIVIGICGIIACVVIKMHNRKQSNHARNRNHNAITLYEDNAVNCMVPNLPPPPSYHTSDTFSRITPIISDIQNIISRESNSDLVQPFDFNSIRSYRPNIIPYSTNNFSQTAEDLAGSL